jgi:hypothetical protein
LSAELDARLDQLKASEMDLKNIVYRVIDARKVLEYEYKKLSHECIYHMELHEALDRDLINCYKSLQNLNEDYENLRGQLKELEEAALPIARLLVPHPGRPKTAPLVDRLKEAPGRLPMYVKHLVKSIPSQVLAYMKSYFPKAPVDVIVDGLAQIAPMISNSVPLHIQLMDFMYEQAKINKDTVTKFKAIDKVLENIDSKVTEVGSSNHQVLNMMTMLETQVGQLVRSLSANGGKLPGQPKGPETAKAIQTRSGKETEDPECPAGARKPKLSAEVEEFSKEEVTEIITEEPEFDMSGEYTKIPQLKPHYF